MKRGQSALFGSEVSTLNVISQCSFWHHFFRKKKVLSPSLKSVVAGVVRDHWFETPLFMNPEKRMMTYFFFFKRLVDIALKNKSISENKNKSKYLARNLMFSESLFGSDAICKKTETVFLERSFLLLYFPSEIMSRCLWHHWVAVEMFISQRISTSSGEFAGGSVKS